MVEDAKTRCNNSESHGFKSGYTFLYGTFMAHKSSLEVRFYDTPSCAAERPRAPPWYERILLSLQLTVSAC